MFNYTKKASKSTKANCDGTKSMNQSTSFSIKPFYVEAGETSIIDCSDAIRLGRFSSFQLLRLLCSGRALELILKNVLINSVEQFSSEPNVEGVPMSVFGTNSFGVNCSYDPFKHESTMDLVLRNPMHERIKVKNLCLYGHLIKRSK